MHDSQGFRLQKLRGGLASPYERTIFLDSDTRACKDPGATLFPLLRNTDVACVWGGRGNHSGASAGVLAFAKNAGPTRSGATGRPSTARSCNGRAASSLLSKWPCARRKTKV